MRLASALASLAAWAKVVLGGIGGSWVSTGMVTSATTAPRRAGAVLLSPGVRWATSMAD